MKSDVNILNLISTKLSILGKMIKQSKSNEQEIRGLHMIDVCAHIDCVITETCGKYRIVLDVDRGEIYQHLSSKKHADLESLSEDISNIYTMMKQTQNLNDKKLEEKNMKALIRDLRDINDYMKMEFIYT